MSNKCILKRFVAAAGLVVLGATAVQANMPVTYAVSGSVTAAPSGGQISVNGRWYHIDPQSEAAIEISGVHTGDQVKLTLNGPPTADSTEVVEIHATNDGNH